MVRFDWDEYNQGHIAEHNVSCAEAEQVIHHDPFDLEVQTESGEERLVQLGETNAGRILIVVTTCRDILIRVVTAFDAPKAMKTLYIAQKGNFHGSALKVPEFKNEGDEANWWIKNQDRLTQQFERAAAEGTLGRGTCARRGNTPTTTIRLDPEDIEKARFQAEQKGLKYQTYLKMLIRQALRQEDLRNDPIIQRKESHMPTKAKRPGLDDRSRNADGEIRKKRTDTLIGTLREKYGDSVAEGYRSDAKLGTVLKREGLDDLSQLLKKKR